MSKDDLQTFVIPTAGELTEDMQKIKFIGETLIQSIHFLVSEDITDILIKPDKIMKKEVGKWECVPDITPENFHFKQFVEALIKVNPSADPRNGRASDLAFTGEDGLRIRVQVFTEGGIPCAAIRILPRSIKTFTELGFNKQHIPLIEKVALRRNGLILFCGPTGNGKSSSMAALLNIINQTSEIHILTIEDPVETILPQGKATVTQREVGIDIARSGENDDVDAAFSRGIDESLRQTPDVIMLGEVRTNVGTRQIIRASESGHLAMTSLHASDSIQCLQTLFNRLDGHLNPEAVASQLAKQVVAIIAQRLIRLKNGKVQLIYEILDLTSEKMISAVRNQKWNEIKSIMNEMNTPEINKQITALMKKEAISKEEANRVIYM